MTVQPESGKGSIFPRDEVKGERVNAPPRQIHTTLIDLLLRTEEPPTAPPPLAEKEIGGEAKSDK